MYRPLIRQHASIVGADRGILVVLNLVAVSMAKAGERRAAYRLLKSRRLLKEGCPIQ